MEAFDLATGQSLRSRSFGPEEYLANHREQHGGANTGIVALDTSMRDGSLRGFWRGPIATPPGSDDRSVLHSVADTRQSVREIGSHCAVSNRLPSGGGGTSGILFRFVEVFDNRIGKRTGDDRRLWGAVSLRPSSLGEEGPSVRSSKRAQSREVAGRRSGSHHVHALDAARRIIGQGNRGPGAVQWNRAVRVASVGLLFAALLLVAR